MQESLNNKLKVNRITTGQDENGNPIQTTESWERKCKFKHLSTKSLMYAGLSTEGETIEITWRYKKGFEIRNGDTVEIDGKVWLPEGVTEVDSRNRPQWIKQVLKNG